ncbi:MAG: sensor histidine kinase [Bacteroidota bacterium]
MVTGASLGVASLALGLSGMFLLSVAVVIFFTIYQRKLQKQQAFIAEERLRYKDELLSATLEVQEREKVRIGRDLHDEIGSMLSSAILSLSLLPKPENDTAETHHIQRTQKILNETAENVRAISRDLVPSALYNLGFTEGIGSLCDRFTNGTGFKIDYSLSSGIDNQMDKHIQIHLYRIINELIANTVKHAEAEKVEFSLDPRGDNWNLIYQDNGKGMNMAHLTAYKGLGLKSIEGRVSSLGGEVEFSSKPKEGIKVDLTIPIKAHNGQPNENRSS